MKFITEIALIVTTHKVRLSSDITLVYIDSCVVFIVTMNLSPVTNIYLQLIVRPTFVKEQRVVLLFCSPSVVSRQTMLWPFWTLPSDVMQLVVI